MAFQDSVIEDEIDRALKVFEEVCERLKVREVKFNSLKKEQGSLKDERKDA